MISVKIGSGVDATKEVKYTLKPGECGDVTSSDVSAMTSVNWLTVTVADGVITIKTKEANTGKERTGCVTPTIKGEPCDENRIMVTQKETDPEPPKPKECSNFIVNGDDYVVSKDGDRICDSAFLNVTQEEAHAYYQPESARDWITYEWKHWDVDPHNWETFCSVYSAAPCVAESLMRHAGVIDTPKPEACNGGSPPLTSFNQKVQDAVNCVPGSYCHALGTIWYIVAPNPSEHDRECTITWYINNIECQSTTFHVRQKGTGSAEGCTFTLTIAGLPEGDTAEVTWGDGKIENLPNGTHSHESAYSNLETKIKKTDYIFNPSVINFKCGETTETTTTGEQGACKCNKFTSVTGNEIDYTEGRAEVATYVAESDCVSSAVITHESGNNIINLNSSAGYTFSNNKLIAVVTQNTQTDPRTGTYSISLNGQKCDGKNFTVKQKGVPTPTEWSIDVRLANVSGESVRFRNLEIKIAGRPTSLTPSIDEEVTSPGEAWLYPLTFPNAANAPEGCTISEIKVDVTNSQGVTRRVNLVTSNNALFNGHNYLFCYGNCANYA